MKLFATRNEEFLLLKKAIDSKISNSNHKIKILEAGCGRKWPLEIDRDCIELTGVDLDKDALALRNDSTFQLDTEIHGSIVNTDIVTDKYDVIYCSYVLEHVEGAELALSNFINWLKPGGILIIRIPDRDSVFGFTTRFSPYWFHVFYYKTLKGVKAAGKPGFPPYPTFYDPVVSLRGIRKFCSQNSLEIIEEYGKGFHVMGKGFITKITKLYSILLFLISLGKLSWRHGGLTYVIKK